MNDMTTDNRMRVFVAGATGAVGRPLVKKLVAAGHDVTGMTRSASKAGQLEAAGARAVVADALDARAVGDAAALARPEVVINQLTDLTSIGDNLRRFDHYFEVTNRLRTEGNDNLMSAAVAAGARRFIAQSFTGWPYAREGALVKTEDDRLDPHPPKGLRATHAAISRLESTTATATEIEGLVLRYCFFYGPGTSIGPDAGADQIEAVRRRRLPIVGGGEGIWSFTHVDDAASAAVAALQRGTPGLYNVVDDEPAPVHQWLPALADAAGAPAPRRVPRWLGAVAGGPVAVAMMCEIRGASNAKAKRELGWSPAWPSWRRGFPAVLAGGS